MEARMCKRWAPIIRRRALRLASDVTVLDYEDLCQAGTIGLIEAIRSYKKGKKAKFSSWAYYRIMGSMYDELRNHSGISRNAYKHGFKLFYREPNCFHGLATEDMPLDTWLDTIQRVERLSRFSPRQQAIIEVFAIGRSGDKQKLAQRYGISCSRVSQIWKWLQPQLV